MRPLLALLLLAATVAATTAADPPAATVKAYAVNINHPPKDASPEIVSKEYTGVYLFVSAPGRQIVALDPATSKLTVTDDKGTDLTGPTLKLAPAVPTDKTKSQGRMYLLGNKAPAAGATRVRVKGELTFLCGVGEKTAAAESLTLKAKEKVEVGPAAFEVTIGKDRPVVVLKTESPLLKSVTFTGPDAKPVAVVGTLNLGLNPAGKVAQSANYTPSANATVVAIKVVHYEKIEAVKVTVDTETGVGP